MHRKTAAEAHLSGYQPGDLLLGKYRLVKLLAVGGMGAVWSAYNELLQSDVALKINFASNEGSGAERAHSEARLAAQLPHPALCRALDFGVSELGDPIVVSELLQGDSLDALLRKQGPFSPTRAAQLMIPVLDGLASAHAKNIVHRDVKPSNIFLARSETGELQPKLLDFGIARGIAEKTRLTVEGTVCGTPDYMSPEQARGRQDVDERSDVWSVCATLYELVSGRVPFSGANYNAVMFEVINTPAAPLPELKSQDRELGSIISGGLTKDRQRRTQTARQLANELSKFLLSRGIDVDACGHALRSRQSQPELVLAELRPEHTDLREASLAATIERKRTTGSARRRPAASRWGAAGVLATLLLFVGAWGAGHHDRAGELPLRLATESQPTDAPKHENLEEMVPASAAAVDERSWGRQAAAPSDAPRAAAPPQVAAAAVSPRASSASTASASFAPPVVSATVAEQSAPRTPNKPVARPTNALGYDFGL